MERLVDAGHPMAPRQPHDPRNRWTPDDGHHWTYVPEIDPEHLLRPTGAYYLPMIYEGYNPIIFRPRDAYATENHEEDEGTCTICTEESQEGEWCPDVLRGQPSGWLQFPIVFGRRRHASTNLPRRLSTPSRNSRASMLTVFASSSRCKQWHWW